MRWGDPDFHWLTFLREWGPELDENSAGLYLLVFPDCFRLARSPGTVDTCVSDLHSGSTKVHLCSLTPAFQLASLTLLFPFSGVLSLSLAFDKIWSRLSSASGRICGPGVLCVDILSLKWVPRSRQRCKGSSRKSHSAPSPSYVLQCDRLEVLYLGQYIWYYTLSPICLLASVSGIVRMQNGKEVRLPQISNTHHRVQAFMGSFCLIWIMVLTCPPHKGIWV